MAVDLFEAWSAAHTFSQLLKAEFSVFVGVKFFEKRFEFFDFVVLDDVRDDEREDSLNELRVVLVTSGLPRIASCSRGTAQC